MARATKKTASNEGVAVKSVTGYMATRHHKLPAGDIYAGEMLPNGIMKTAVIQELVEQGVLVRVYDDGSSDPIQEDDQASAPKTVERLILQPDTAALRQLLSEPADLDRVRAAQKLAISQGRTLLAAALALAVHYGNAGSTAHAPADRL